MRPNSDFRRADFVLFRDLLGRIPWDKPLEVREVQESSLIRKDHFLKSLKLVHPEQQESCAKSPVCMNKKLLAKLKHKGGTTQKEGAYIPPRKSGRNIEALSKNIGMWLGKPQPTWTGLC